MNYRYRLFPSLVLIATAFAMAGCSSNQGGITDNRQPAPQSSASGPAAPQSSAKPASQSPSAATPIVIELPGQSVAGELDGSAASASLLAQLPLTLEFRDHSGQEKLAPLPAPLDLGDAPAGSDAAPLTIGYYAPAQSLVLYYRQVGYFSGIVPLGTYQDADALQNQADGFTATIRSAN
ncbi:cyclophilin-like fold protein [Arthrobacter citreus]|uniref:cyclophilin-like fold protein n=1 Tax=Arthrobacter citreus TaxID=1670 RepID=UPI0036DEF404